MKREPLIFTLLFSLFTIGLQGQSLEDAKNWYLEGRYADALPLFREAYRNDGDDAALNQWLGSCLMNTGSLMEAESYLTVASQGKIPEAYLSLGRLRVKMYRFEEAEEEFDKYQRANRRNEEALERLEKAREEAERLKRMISRTEDVQVIDSLVLPKSAFLAHYNLSRSSGTVMSVNDFFEELPPSDKSLFINERGDKIYYSRQESEGSFSLYTREKLLDSFGNEKRLPESINSEENQAYPFVMSDGMTLYFASTGHQSLGGYDLFVTRYNLATDSYLAPNQLNMPFNSPFNDYMMAVDEEKGVGWFASDRFQPEDSVCLYTFIPNPQVTLLESDDEAYMNRRARISSIAESWRESIDYAPLRAAAGERRATEQVTKEAFTFIINDRVTYHNLGDFRDEHARSLFSQALGMEKQLTDLHQELSEKRDQFAGGASENITLRAAIIRLEREAGSLYSDIGRLKKQARNEEIIALEQK